ncbi:MAG: assembly factor cbp4 [Thelocarpon impressellum]|nr:MAG: assembly factor cbp4 [Thelocarpon impressellum]
MPGYRLYAKMFTAGAVLCIGGPALIIYVTPTEEELFKRYNPELQKRSLENRQGTQEDFDRFVGKLKEYSKSDKPIWEAAAQDEARMRARGLQDQTRVRDEVERRREEIKRHSMRPE